MRLQLYAVQFPGRPIPGFVGLLRNMINEGGVSSIYAGLSASLTRQCTYGTARMGIHRSISDFLQDRNGGKYFRSVAFIYFSPSYLSYFRFHFVGAPISFAEKSAAGIIGGALAVCIGTPFDVTLVRMQADTMKAEVSESDSTCSRCSSFFNMTRRRRVIVAITAEWWMRREGSRLKKGGVSFLLSLLSLTPSHI